MTLWMIQHCMFAYGNYVQNDESLIEVQRELRRHSNLRRNHAVPTCNTILCWVNVLITRGAPTNRKPVEALRTVRAPETRDASDKL